MAIILPAMTQTERRTRGFLFADLRGWTAFVEAHGDAEAAVLLTTYRDLVRATVAQFGGAEIKTEGDSFYVVFDAASGAVECGLALVDAAAAASREHPERPIRVGVGIHAGETIEMDGGYVGSAVNVAARVCSVARAGEVAITETVQGLVRTGLPVHFVPRGTPKLKGIDQPIEIYVVRRGPAPSIPAWRRLASKPWGLAAGLVAAAAVVAIVASLGGAVLFAGGPTTPSQAVASAEPSAPRAVPITAADIEAAQASPLALPPDTYQLPEVQPPIEFEIDRTGWQIDRVFPDGFNLKLTELGSGAADGRGLGAAPPGGYVAGGVVQIVLTGPCQDSKTEVIESDPAALINWLQTNDWLTVTDPVPVNLGGRTGLQVDVSQAKSPRGTCTLPPDLSEEARDQIDRSVFIFMFGEDDFWVGQDETVRIIVVDVDGKPFTILEGSTPSDAFPALVEAAQPMLESMRFAPD